MTDANRTETLDIQTRESNRPQENRVRQQEEQRRSQEQTLRPQQDGRHHDPEPTDPDTASDDGHREDTKRSGKGSYLREHPLAMLLLIIIAILAVGAGVYFWIEHLTWETTDDAQIDTHIASISPRVSGHIIKVYVEDGQPVHANDPLVDIDPTDYEVAVAQARANLADAEANVQAASSNVPITAVNTSQQIQMADAGVASAQAGISAAEKNYAAALANIRLSTANAAKAQADLERYKQLVAKDEISKQQYDQAVATAESTAATEI